VAGGGGADGLPGAENFFPLTWPCSPETTAARPEDCLCKFVQAPFGFGGPPSKSGHDFAALLWREDVYNRLVQFNLLVVLVSFFDSGRCRPTSPPSDVLATILLSERTKCCVMEDRLQVTFTQFISPLLE
jgi:hypothetical protein